MNLIRPVTVGLWLLTSVSALAAGPVSPVDPHVIDLCLDLKRPLKMCRCSASKLVEQTSPGGFSHYAAVGAAYLQNKRSGMRQRAAWSNAVNEISLKSGTATEPLADLLDTIAGQHRMTMQQCSRL